MAVPICCQATVTTELEPGDGEAIDADGATALGDGAALATVDGLVVTEIGGLAVG